MLKRTIQKTLGLLTVCLVASAASADDIDTYELEIINNKLSIFHSLDVFASEQYKEIYAMKHTK